MRSVVVLGKGVLAIHVAEWFDASPDYDLRWIVPVIPEPTWTDSLASWARDRNIPVVADGDHRSIPGVRGDDWHVDLAFSVFYERIVEEWFIDRCGMILNLHNAPLPKYRGRFPVNWALKRGEREHGVTIHHITPGIDAGPIVAQVKFSIYPEFDEVIDVYQRALGYGARLFDVTMPLLDRITPVEQDETQATYFSAKDGSRLGERRDFTREKSVQSSDRGS